MLSDSLLNLARFDPFSVLADREGYKAKRGTFSLGRAAALCLGAICSVRLAVFERYKQAPYALERT